MTRHRLRCLRCDATSEPTLELHCAECGGLFRVEYDEPPSAEGPRLPWEAVTLGEGDTPLVRVELEGGFWAKLEFQAPTGSFKDRGAAILIGAAQEFGVREFVEDSSGNAGAALAAYGSSVGMRAHIFLPADAHVRSWPRLSAGACRTLCRGRALPLRTPRSASPPSAGCRSSRTISAPTSLRGMKPVAWELVERLEAPPDQIVLPVGNGSLLLGLQRGFEELLAIGRLDRLPRLHAAQSESVEPLVAAVNGRATRPAMATVADGIAVASPPRLDEMVAAIRASGGTATAIPEAAILDAQRQLAQHDLACEPTSAVPLVALAHLRERGVIADADQVVLPLTGAATEAAPSSEGSQQRNGNITPH